MGAALSLGVATVSQEESGNRIARALSIQENAARLFRLGLSPEEIIRLIPQDPCVEELSISAPYAVMAGSVSVEASNIELTVITNPSKVRWISAEFDNDDLDDERFYPLLKDPQTWDRTLITLALGYEITSYAKLKLEYYILDEKTGDSEAKAAEQNRNYQPSVDDDQLLLQLELNF